MTNDIKGPTAPDLKDELAVDETEQRNWKGMAIALLVIVSICSLIVLSILLLTPHLGFDHEKLTLEDLIFEGYERKDFNGSWISEHEIVYLDSNGAIILYDVKSKSKIEIASNITLRTYDVKQFSLSQDRRYVLLTHEITKTGTYSFKAKYKILDTLSNAITPIRVPGPSQVLEHAEWGPKFSQLLIVYGNDLIYYSHPGDQAVPVTSNGREHVIYNGIPDMMYEEHILKSKSAFWWYKDGSRLAFATFDNSRVELNSYVIYGTANTTTFSSITSYDSEYPKIIRHPYPKPGQVNPQVILWIVDVNYAIRNIKKLTPPKEITGLDFYLTAPLVWVTRSKVCVVWSRRSQNLTIISICSEEMDWNCEKVTEEHLLDVKGWLFINNPPLFKDDGDKFFLLLPAADRNAGTFTQIAVVDSNSGEKHFLTHGQFIVTKLISFRNDTNTIYFMAAPKEEPGQRHLFSVALNTRTSKISCLSCNISEECLFNDVILSPNNRSYILQCLGPGYPRYYLKNVDTQNSELLDINPSFQRWIREKKLPVIRHLTVTLAENRKFRVLIVLPPELNEEEDAKFPVLIHLNGFPGNQLVNYLHKLDLSRYLASRRDIISIFMDVRGSGMQGDKFMFEAYHRLGEADRDDIIDTIKFLKSQLRYLDDEKIGIWGQKYGGFLAISLFAKDELFKCGIAVAPITNLRNYFSVFSERYMGMPWPQDNYVNYEKADLVRKAKDMSQKFKYAKEKSEEKSFLLIHGTKDEIVNLQHTMLFVKSLTEEGSLQYKTQLYPDSGIMESWDHKIKLHFYKTMEDFFLKCFKSEEEHDDIFIKKVTKIKP